MRIIQVRGAGLSGLSAAINLKLRGFHPIVHEKNASVGMQTRSNFQVLKCNSPEEYLSSINLRPTFSRLEFSKAILSTPGRDIELNLKSRVFFVKRGGADSLETGLFKQAEKIGVDFKFNSNIEKAEINATGPRRVDASAYGVSFESKSFPKDYFLMMYDDRYSPKGWYLYAVPYGKDKVKVVNCCSMPYCSKAKQLLFKALKERSILKQYFEGLKPVDEFAGYGGCWIPKTAVIDGVIQIGEAAGFQDPFRGFGMNFALESGFLAAKAIAENQDYDKLWKERFMPQFRLDYSRRFFMSIFGSMLVDLAYRKVKNRDLIEFKSGDVKGLAGSVLKSMFCKAEEFKRGLTGHW